MKGAMQRTSAFLFGSFAVAAVAAPLLAAGHPLATLLIRDFFAAVCHQQPARSFMLAGAPVAVCVRCLGIYCGAAAGAATGSKARRGLLACALMLNAVDVCTALLHWHGNLPGTRFALGFFLGWSAGALLAAGTLGKKPLPESYSAR